MRALRTAGTAAGSGMARARTTLAWEPPVQDVAAWARSTPVLAVFLLALTFPIVSVLPRTGPDPSWQAGLYLALEGGVDFGRDFVFTYGPLGFLHAPVLYGEGLFLVSLGFTFAVRFVLAASLLWTARRSLPLPLALAACYVVLVVGHLNSALILVAFLWAFAALDDRASSVRVPVLACGGGLLAAIELLGKLNYGISIFLLCGLALAALPGRRRNLTMLVGTFLTALLILWTVTGQALVDLPPYFSNSAQIISGYSQSMGIDIEARPHEYVLPAVAMIVLLVTLGLATRGDRRTVRWVSLGLLGLFAFVCFKQDFIRRGIEGRADFSLMMASAAIAVAARIPAGGRIHRSVFASALIALMILYVAWANPVPSFLKAVEPKEHLLALHEDLDAMTNRALRESERGAARREMRSAYAVPAWMLHRIGDRNIAFDPWEIGVAWAYGLNWKPLPVIQDYSAYTPGLDRMNAAALGGSGPEVILRRDLRGNEHPAVGAVDDRYPAWDPPAVSLALLCNYRELGAQAGWQLVEKTPDRCSPTRALGVARAETGEAIHVPQPPRGNEIVFARIGGLNPDAAERIRTLAYRGPLGWVSFDGRGRWNMATATAGDGLILSAPAKVDFRHPYQLAPDAGSFRVGIDGADRRPISVAFYSRRVEPQRAVGAPRVANSAG